MRISSIANGSTTSRQISRAIVREWNTLRNITKSEGIAVFVSGEYGHTFAAYASEWRGDYALDAWAWFDAPAEARLYVLRHIGIVLPL